jgi:hypothetical protein
MQTLFINLGVTQILWVFAISFLLLLYAGILALKREKGLTQILWLFGIVFVPPLFAIVYLLKVYLFKQQYRQ